MDDIIVRRTRLPRGVFGLVIRDPAGDYNIYLADWLPPSLERRTFEHELYHIRAGHIDSLRPVFVLEWEAREACRE